MDVLSPMMCVCRTADGHLLEGAIKIKPSIYSYL